MCAASESYAAPGGLQEHTSPEETGGPPVAGCRAGSKGWNEKGDMRPFFFLTKNTFKCQNYTTLHLYSYASLKPRKQITQIQLLGCGDYGTSLVAAFHHLVSYLHSPFPLALASHLPPFRHDSVGRVHFRPVEQIKDDREI